MTLGIGLGFVALLQMFAYHSSDSPAAAHKVEPTEILIARPGENPPLTSPSKLELSCYDPQILPVWHELKKDKKFKAWTKDVVGIYDCAAMLEVKQIDLNNDGQLEVLARGKDFPLCGNGRAGCGFWIFSNRNDRHRVLLSAADHAYTADLADVLKKSRTRGFSDVLLKTFLGPGDEMKFSTHVYNGRDYVESRCVCEIEKQDPRTEGSLEMITCQEFARRDGFYPVNLR